MRRLASLLATVLLAACSMPGPKSSPVPAPEVRNASLASIVEFLLASAAKDFHTHRPPDPQRFREVRVGHRTLAGGDAQYMLCGQFLPKGQAEWTAFATIKTSDYEQWLGGYAASYCQGPTVVWDEAGDLSAELQGRLDALR